MADDSEIVNNDCNIVEVWYLLTNKILKNSIFT